MNIDAQLRLVLNARVQVSHLVMIVNPVHHEVWEPRILALVRLLEQGVEELQTLLAEVVSENFEGH